MDVGIGYEKQLIGIIRKLPPDRVSQVIDFAKFLESQLPGILNYNIGSQDQTKEEISEEDEQWDTLLATDEPQQLLEKMA